jgi:predicted metal-dependent phosphotriesterase family hydrolase
MTYDIQTQNENRGRDIAKLIAILLKTGLSIGIEVGLNNQERMAKEEGRSNDLKWINVARNIKHDVEPAINDWIVNL